MSQTAVRMAKAEESEGSDRTLQELRDSLRDAFERVGKNLRYLDYTLRPVLEIYPNLRESQVTEQHFENYGPKRIALAEVKGETVSKKTIQRELNAFRHLLTVDRQGYSARQAAKKTGLSRGKLQGWRRNGVFNPPDGIYYDEEIDALKKIKSLVDQGAPIRALQRIGRSLCQQHRYASNAEAFLRMDLIWRDGDICEPIKGGGYISWLYQPGQPTGQGEDTLAVVGESFINDELAEEVRKGRLSEPTRRMYARDLRVHVFPSLGHLPIAEVERHLRSFAFDKNDERYIPNTIEAWLSLVARIAEHARRQGLYDGPKINKFVSGLNAQNRDRETHGPEAIREFARQVEMPFNIWYLMGALNGFRPRERCVFQWGRFTEDPPTMAIRLNLVDGKIKQVSDRRIDDRPISRSIAALLSAWRKVTPFGGDDDYIFASSTGKLPVATSRIYREHLDPAADALSVRRVSLYRLHHIAIRLTGKHGLTREQQTIVLKLDSRRGPPPSPSMEHLRTSNRPGWLWIGWTRKSSAQRWTGKSSDLGYRAVAHLGCKRPRKRLRQPTLSAQRTQALRGKVSDMMTRPLTTNADRKWSTASLSICLDEPESLRARINRRPEKSSASRARRFQRSSARLLKVRVWALGRPYAIT